MSESDPFAIPDELLPMIKTAEEAETTTVFSPEVAVSHDHSLPQPQVSYVRDVPEEGECCDNCGDELDPDDAVRHDGQWRCSGCACDHSEITSFSFEWSHGSTDSWYGYYADDCDVQDDDELVMKITEVLRRNWPSEFRRALQNLGLNI